MTEMLRNSYRNLCLGVLVGFAAFSAEAGDNAGLLKKLVEKGVITEGEAAVLAEEANSEFNNTMPSWVNSMTLKGDLRLRAEQKQDGEAGGYTGNRPARYRFRYRFRFGGTADIGNGWKAGFRLASGGTQPGSTNTTMDDHQQNDDIYIDQAYASWSGNGFTVYGGKMPSQDKTGFKFSKAILDGDITPEGLQVHYNDIEFGSTTVGINTGVWIQDENSGDSNDEYLYLYQIASSTSLSDTMKLDLAWGGYTSQGGQFDDTIHSDNAGNDSGENFSISSLDAALSIKQGPGVKLYGSLIENHAADTAADGLLYGVKFGSAKKAGQWEAGIEYRELEANSVYDDYSDSDFGAYGTGSNAGQYYNGTDVEGIVLKSKYNLYDNVQLGFTWYRTENNDADGSIENPNENDRFQFDAVFKF